MINHQNEDLNISDKDLELIYNNITDLASQICGTEMAFINLTGEGNQNSKPGNKLNELLSGNLFCNHTLQHSEGFFEVEDARQDPRFKNNPLTKDDPYVVFYAGALFSDDNGPVGTLCVMDKKPKKLDPKQLGILKPFNKIGTKSQKNLIPNNVIHSKYFQSKLLISLS